MIEIFFKDLISYIIPFFIFLFSIAIISYPFTRIFFKNTSDENYTISQITGTFFLAWIYFAICTLGFITNIDFLKLKSLSSLVLALIIWISLNLFLAKKFKVDFRKTLLKSRFTDLITLIFIFIFYFIHSFQERINLGGSENYMNLAILNSLSNSENIPPRDMWFSGEELNYYYFGHVVFFLIIKILNFNPNESFFFIATFTPVLFFSALFFLVQNLYLKFYPSASKTSLLVTSIFTFLFTFLTNPILTTSALIDWLTGKVSFEKIYYNYYQLSIRVMDNIISKNYLYAFLLNPLHALTTNLPLALIVIFLIFKFFDENQKLTIKNPSLLLFFFTLGIMGSINTWDIVFYLSLFGFLFILYHFETLKKNWIQYLKTLALLMYPLILAILPWFAFFLPPAGALGIIRSSANYLEFLLFWGLYFILILVVYLYNLKRKIPEFFSFSFIFCLIVLLLLEIFYIKDANDWGIYYRANTYYKFSNSIILVFSIGIGVLFSNFLINSKQKIIKFLLLILIASTFWYSYVYMLIKTRSYDYGGIINQEIIIKEYDEDLFSLYEYFKSIDRSGINILEGAAPSGFSANYISTFTGTPTLYAWESHTWTWRYNKHFFDELEGRSAAVIEVYTGKDLSKSQEIIEKYDIEYVVLSKVEEKIYQDKLNREKLVQLGEVVFEQNGTKLIKTK